VLGLSTSLMNTSLCFLSLIWLDLVSGAVRYILGRDGGGIGAFDIHPSGTHIAVAERSSTNAAPHVFIYALPSLDLTHVLEDGTERAYSDVGFSGRGDKLVTVGSFPDFLLSVWDWQQQRGVLRTKAFGQEVCYSETLGWNTVPPSHTACACFCRCSMRASQLTMMVVCSLPAQATYASGAWRQLSRASSCRCVRCPGVEEAKERFLL
jgi:hypothetical protein